jgi:transposase
LYGFKHPVDGLNKTAIQMKTTSVKKARATKSNDKMITMPTVNPHAAGIDLGSKSHFVCVAQDNVKEFGVFTSDLHDIAKHLKSYGVKTVAIESTGFYWRPIYLLLLDYGFEVFLVNAAHLKNVKGHKTDVVDSRWLQLLHSIGLLSNSFQPDTLTHELRTYTRHRKNMIADASHIISKMNKVLVLMNIQLHGVLRNITGESGLKVIRAILQGERDPKILSSLVSLRVKAKREDIEKALTGEFRKEYLFELGQCFQLYNFYWQKIEETDKQIEAWLKEYVSNLPPDDGYKRPKNKNKGTNDPTFNIGSYVHRITGGIELLDINGVGSNTILTLVSETGLDMSKFQTAKHFASWLGFAPNRKVTGGKEISSRTRKKTNPLAKVIRDAANSTGNSKSKLGDFFRHLAFRKGRTVAIGATARKIAVIIYKMLTEGKPYCYEYAQEQTEYLKVSKLKSIIKTMDRFNISKADLKLAWSK